MPWPLQALGSSVAESRSQRTPLAGAPLQVQVLPCATFHQVRHLDLIGARAVSCQLACMHVAVCT